jgi:hypothetical protein
MADTIEIIQGTATVVEVAGPTGPQGPAGASQGDALTTQGDLLYRGASSAARLGIGTAGQILKVNAGATAPEWGAAPASGVSSVAGRTGDVTLAVADVTGAVSTSRQISAGTGLTGGGDLTADRTLTVSYGTTAGTACEGNDSRIANIPNGTGSIALGQSGTRTTLNGAASGSDKTISLPNATGTVALTQQATDYEVTDETKGVIMKSANGTRWRVTIDDNGSLLRTALATLILSALMLCGTKAQVRDLVYGTNNVVVGPTNGVALSFTNSVAFSNPITFGTNAATTRTNLGLDWSALTNSNTATSLLGFTTNGQVVANTTNSLSFTNQMKFDPSVVTFDYPTFYTGVPLWVENIYNTVIAGGSDNRLIGFYGGVMAGGNGIVGPSLTALGLGFSSNTIIAKISDTNINFEYAPTFTNTAAGTRTNLGLGSLATNNSVPSGAATTNSLLTADGAGGSSFVVSRTVTRYTTNDQTKTNWGFNAITQTNNNDPHMGSWSLDANSFYRVEYAVAWVATTNSGFAHGLGFTTNLSEFNHRTGVGQAANITVTSITSGTNATAIGLANVSAAATGGRFAVAGFVYVLTSSNATTMNYRWYPINNSADASTLVRSSMLSVTKMSP